MGLQQAEKFLNRLLGPTNNLLTFQTSETVSVSGTADTSIPTFSARAGERKMKACEGASLKGEQFGSSNLPVRPFFHGPCHIQSALSCPPPGSMNPGTIHSSVPAARAPTATNGCQ